MATAVGHRIGRDEIIWAFGPELEPVLEIEPGETVTFETNDCFTGQITSEDDLVTASGKKPAVAFREGSESDPRMLRVGPIGPGIVHWAAALRRRSRTISVSVLMNSGFASPPVARV